MRGRPLRPALAGVAAVLAGVGAGELVAAFLSPTASPFAVVGGALIDAAPAWAKETAIALFGTGDKAALLTGIAVVVALVAAGAGVLEARRPPWGRVVAASFGVVGAIVAMTRPDAGAISWVPSVVAGGVAALALALLAPRAARAAASGDAASGADADAAALDRRGFLVWLGGTAAAGALLTVVGTVARGGAQAVGAVRDLVRLPAPSATAPPVPPGAELGIDGLAAVITPNAEFYRIDTALVVPQIDPSAWTLRIHGMVGQEVVLTWDELLALPLEESVTTLTCVSNEVGGDLIGNARWLGYPIRELLARAVPDADADMVLSRSSDGFTASTPLEVLTDDRAAILAVGMNGDPLPLEHGFPVRMVVPGLYGYVSATKWVTELEVTRFDRASAYWTDRGWSERGPVKLESRIDVPRIGASVPVGDTVIAGVAWQQHVGVSKVEVQVDDGPWTPATLASAISADTWVQWRADWTATAGRHTIRCRATNAQGQTQTPDRADVVPDGATGWHEIQISVG